MRRTIGHPDIDIAFGLHDSARIHGGLEDNLIAGMQVQFGEFDFRRIRWIGAGLEHQRRLGTTGIRFHDLRRCRPVGVACERGHRIELHVKVIDDVAALDHVGE
jgi:hypothetical protein